MPEFALTSLVIVGLGLLALIALVVLAYRVVRAPAPPVPAPPIPREAYGFLTVDEDVPAFARHAPVLAAQSDDWRQAFAAAGHAMAEGGVRRIFYSHGTFVGSDPIGVTKVLMDLHPQLGEGMARKAAAMIKRGNDWLTKDLGNFPAEYIALCRDGLDPALTCQEFLWSSGNNHFARLEGALVLFVTLAESLEPGFDQRRHRFLLVGHSHAGQVFALFTQLMGDGELRARLHELILKESLISRARLEQARAALRDVSIDFVTLGTPPVYPWHLGPNHRLLHVINHRGDEPLGGDLSGLLVTKAGDYIQQFGILGSDTIALTKRERQLNADLDEILGRGFSMTAWISNLRNQRRLPAQGFTYLVDYKDAGRIAPNFLRTFFGHGVYTRYQHMLFLHQLMARHFYG